MKKIFSLFLASILLFNGCVKVEDIYVKNIEKNNSEVSFKTNANSTKAIIEGTEMQDDFGVYGWVVAGDYSGSGAYLMKNAKYDKNGDAADGKAYYWPKSDNSTNVSFIFTAYSQYSENPTWENDTLKVSVPEITQELINNPDNFNDVLYAQTVVDHHQNALETNERVALNFSHALTWLQFTARVANNESVKWVKIKSVKFNKYQEGQAAVDANPGSPEVPYQAAYNDTTDTWFNLKRGTNVDGSATKTRVKSGEEWGSYVDNYALPDALVSEIKSYYSIDNGTPGDYDLHMGNSVWPSATIKQLRVVKDIPADYKLPVELYGGVVMDFFNGYKYLKDNGYDIQPRNSGGKPAVWNYVLLDCFVNGTAYTVVGFNCAGVAYSAPQYTIVEHPEVPYQPAVPPTEAQPAVPAGYVPDGVYSGGVLAIPTNSVYAETPVANYWAVKNTALNYCPSELTLNTNEHSILGNAIIVPQPVPEYVTVVFDICIHNETGDDVVITDRSISRKINAGKDNSNTDYVASWAASCKYIYNFKFDGDSIDFTVSTSNWSTTTEYNVWDFTM